MKPETKNKTADVRDLNEMRDVLYDKNWAKSAPNLELYYMYRGLKKGDGLRYDITVIPATMLGKEFVKTKGHEHKKNLGEVYIVLEGQAVYLMQKRKGKIIEDVYAIRAKKGQVAVIKPGYGHVSINPLKKTLKMANWMADNCKSSYASFEKFKGACYYYTKKGWIKNKNYKKVPKLRFEKPLNNLPKDLGFLR